MSICRDKDLGLNFHFYLYIFFTFAVSVVVQHINSITEIYNNKKNNRWLDVRKATINSNKYGTGKQQIE